MIIHGAGGGNPFVDNPANADRLLGYHSQRFDDIDEQATRVSDSFIQTYDQLSSGAYCGEISRLDLQNSSFIVETTGQKTIQVGAFNDLCVVWNWNNSSYRYNGRTLKPQELAVGTRGNDFEVLADPLEIVAIRVSESVFSAWCRDVEGFDFTNLFGQSEIRSLPESQMCVAQRAVAGLFESLRENPHITSYEKWRSEVESFFFQLVANAISSAGLVNHSPVRCEQNYLRIVRSAREYLSRHRSEAVTLAELCKNVGTCKRNINYAFLSILGITPSYYLRVQRLNGVRRDIKNHTNPCETLADIAARWGFWHPSHFSAAYKRLFGELPSTTAERAGWRKGAISTRH